MRRWKVRVLVLLLLLAGGAIVNVAVAWGIVWRESREQSPAWPPKVLWRYDDWGGQKWVKLHVVAKSGSQRAWLQWVGANSVVRLPPVQTHSVSIPALTDSRLALSATHWFDVRPFESVAPKWAALAFPCDSDRSDAEYIRMVDVRGWPCLTLASMYQWCHLLDGKSQDPGTETTVGGIPLRRQPASFGVANASPTIPLRPIWPGFAINTVFYAFVLWLLFAAPFALRRRRRIKRGLCPRCAYPVGTSQVCTECGVEIG